MSRATSFAAIATALAAAWAERAAADETIVLKNGSRIRGDVLEYDERGVRIRFGSRRTSFYPANKIDRVEADYLDDHVRADEALAAGDDAKAARGYRTALAGEKREWIRGRIRAGLAKALRGAGDWVAAADVYMQIHAAREDADVLRLAPLVWTDEPAPPTAAIEAARRWLRSEGPPMRKLLGASWLVGRSAADDALSKDALERLRTTDVRIGQIARAQLARRAAQAASGDEIERLAATVAKTPEAIRAGPQYVYGRNLERAERWEDAALAYLRSAYVYGAEGDLAADAIYRAGLAASKAGLAADARILFDEVLRDYPKTPAAKYAAAAQRR